MPNVTTPEPGGMTPIIQAVTEGQTYWWCACGKSATQPFCDGSHTGTTFQPVPWQATRTAKVAFCTSKRTATPPLCDGTHAQLAKE
jgi:CDGSH-type Zn-finger protein